MNGNSTTTGFLLKFGECNTGIPDRIKTASVSITKGQDYTNYSTCLAEQKIVHRDATPTGIVVDERRQL